MPRLKPLKLHLTAVDKISAPVTRLAKRIDKIKKPVREVTSKLRTLDRVSGFKNLRKSAVRVGRQFGRLAKRAALLGTALAAAGVAGVGRIISLGNTVVKTADKLGVGVEKLQEMRFAAERAGVEQRTFDMGLQRFTRRVAEAAAGTGEAKDTLAQMGIQLVDSKGQLRDIVEVFKDVADQMQKQPDAGKRVKASFKLFDSEGVALVNMLTDGADGLERMFAEAQALGGIMSDETARAAEETTDKLQSLKQVATGIAFSVTAQLLPSITELVDKLLAWREENKGLIATRITSFVEGFLEGMREMVKIAKALTPAIVTISKAIGGLAGAIKIIAVVIFAKLIAAVIAFGAALTLTPIGWILAGIAALALGAKLLIDNWEPVSKFFADLWGGIKEKVGGIVNVLPAFARRALGFNESQPQPVGGAPGVLGARSPGAAAALAGAGAGGFAGKVDVSISQERPPRVDRVVSSSPDIDLGVETGLTLLPASGV